jgi:hypothetical protein
MAEKAFRVIIAWLGGAFAIILVVANIAVAVVSPPAFLTEPLLTKKVDDLK